jgi:glycosyltransferase involved in cell wall biosynthesis
VRNILFFTHDIPAGTNPHGYRIQQYFPFLEERNFKVTMMTTGTPLRELIKQLRSADVFYIQRVLPHPLKYYLFRRFARRIVYDFDDAVMLGSKGESRTRRSRFKRMVMGADAVLCGSRFLMDQALAYRADRVFYVPTVVDTDEYPVKRHESNDQARFIGWVGSSSTLKYLLEIEEAFSTLAAAEKVYLKVVADKPPEMRSERVIFEEWSPEGEKVSLQSFDVGIMPVRDDLWSQGKCGAKLLQYMASGLPSISHPVGVAKQIIVDGVNGFLRNDMAGWRDALERLLGDRELRAAMGEAARETVERDYSLKVWGPRVAEIVASL